MTFYFVQKGSDKIAVTKIWKVNSRLDHVIEYATNQIKTYNESYKDLKQVIDYTKNDLKTEKQFYVTGINCSPETAYQEMIITKKQYSKEKGVIAYHAYQSFAYGEVTPETCHEIGVKLAEEMWGDRFEVIITTHLDKEHYHNHFVINSISFKDGKRYYDNRASYAELRHLSDSLCEEYGLSIVKKENNKSKLKYVNYQNKNFNENSYYSTTKKDIDRAIAMAYSYKDFENILKNNNYEIFYRANKISVRRSPHKKNIRIQRCFGDNYSIDKIKERIELEYSPKVPFLEEFKGNKYYRSYNYKKDKPKGIYALYLHYCYLLNVIQKKKVSYKVPTSLRYDIEKLDKISEETRLLVRNILETDEQFFVYKNNLQDKLNNLLDLREKEWDKNRSKKLNNPDYIKLLDLKKQIDAIRKELKLCEDIERRIPSIEKNTNEVIKIERKEMYLDESIK